MEPAAAPEISLLVVAGVSAMMVLSVTVASKVVRHLREFGGRVNASVFSLPDLIAATFLLVWFGGTSAHAFFADHGEIEPMDILYNAIFFTVLIATLCVFLRVRGVHVRELLGLGEITWWKIVPLALLLLVGLYPLFLYAAAASQLLLGEHATDQSLIQYFKDSARESNLRAVLLTVSFGVVFAPLAEEFIFRGYLHGVLKRFCGGVLAALITSALFALVHVNVATLLPLFVFALALTAAYELTGSLLVNVAMHALFNLTNLLLLLHASSAPPP